MPFLEIRRTAVLAAAVVISMLLHAENNHQESSTLHWYRGNTHTHTSASPGSDANASPEYVANWYKAHGYQFVVITDHEHFTDATKVPAVEEGKFLVMQGQEVTQMVADPGIEGGVRHLHVNGIHTDRLIMPMRPPNPPAKPPRLADGTVDLRPLAPQGITPAQAYLRNIDAIRAAGGVPQVNHPNLGWSVRLEDLLPIQGPYLLEIWNAYRTSNNLGGTDSAGNHSPSAESLWDQLLSQGRVVWGVAADDTHDYQRVEDPMAPNPGKGWVVVRADSLTPGAIATALIQGGFYASTGVTLDEYDASQTGITLSVVRPKDWSQSLPTKTRYTFQFIGQNGRVLKEAYGTSASYTFGSSDQYVRVSITDSDGRRAWTQPVFLDGRDKAK
jgi:hypothetical protein